MTSEMAVKQSMQLVERLADGSMRYIPLIDMVSVPAKSGAQYALIDITTGKSPEGLQVKRKGSSLIVESEDDGFLVEITEFYDEPETAFIPQAELDGSALVGTSVTSETPVIDTAANGDEIIWRGGSDSDLVTPTNLVLGGLGLVGLGLAAGGGGGGGSSGGGEAPSSVLNTVNGTIVGGPVVAGNDLRVEVYQADGITLLGEAQINADGTFSIPVGSYLGVVIARVVNAGLNADYLDEATEAGKDLNAELFAMEVVSQPNSTITVNINVLSTLAYHKVQDAAAGGLPTAALVDSTNDAIAELFGLPNLHGTAVVPTNGGSFESNDGLTSGEIYGAVLAALSGADAQNGGDSQQTINDLLAGLDVSDGTATLTESAQGIVVQGGQFTSTQTGQDLTGAVAGVVDTYAPDFTSGATATAINENSSAGQIVYTAAASDAGSVVSYSLKAGDDAALFSINASTGAVTLTGNPDFETKPSYNFTVVATDVAGNASEQVVTLGINNLDDTAPTITSAATASPINENSSAGQVVYTVTSTDSADVVSGATSYSLKAGGDAALFSINTATGAVTLIGSPDYETKASYSFTVVATDAANNASEQTVTLAINDLVDETAPAVSSIAITSASGAQNSTLNAGDVVSVTVNMDEASLVDITGGTPRVALNIGGSTVYADYVSGSGSTALVFQYSLQAGQTDANGISLDANALQANGGTLRDAAGNAANLAHGAVADNASYLVDTTAPAISSGATATAIDENSGAGQTVYTAAATDAGSLTYSLKAGGDAALFTIDVGTGAVTLIGNPNYESKTGYAFTVVATDAAGNSSEQAVTLGINNLDDTAPTITSAATATAISENSGAGQVVYTVTSTDTDDVVSGATSYSLKPGGDSALFSINAVTGAVTLTDSPDYETKASYSFTVVATDVAGNFQEQVVSLAINDLVDEVAPTVSSIAISAATGAQNNSLNAGDVVSVTVTMDEATLVNTAGGTPRVALSVGGSTVYADYVSGSGSTALVFQYTIEAGQTDANGISIATNALQAGGGTLRDAAGNAADLDHGAVADNASYLVDTTAPVISSGATATAIDENSGTGQIVYTAAATDAGGVTYSLKADGDHALLSINASTGAVTLTGNPNYESKTNYAFTVVATDAAGNAIEQTVTLDINNLDDTAPSITSAATATAINENSGAGQVVYTVTSTDNDDVVSGATSYSLKPGGDSALFSINAVTGTVTLTDSPDYETKASYSFTVVATDTAGNFQEQAVTLAINDLVDEVAPTVSSIAISAATGAQNNSLNAGDVVSVTVTMGEATLVDTTGGTPRVALNVGGSTVYADYVSGSGSTALVFEYTIQVGQTDGNGISLDANALQANGGTLRDAEGNAADLDHGAVTDNASYLVDTTAPSFNSGVTATAIDENSGAGQAVYTAAATDAGTVTYSLKADADAALFSIDTGTGAVTLTGNPDYETKPSYGFTVVATDAAGNASEQAVTLAVNDLDEVAPTVSSVAISGATGAQGSLLNAGDVVSVTVTMDENTIVTGTPRVALDIGGSTVYATYVSGSGSSALVFQYVIQASQTDVNGIAIPLNALELNGGTLKDAAGNDAVLAHGAVADNASYQVDTTAPSVTSGAVAAAISENSGAGQTVYTAAATDANTVTYSLKVVGDHAAFSIDGVSGAVTLTGNPDYETKASYSFTVAATDAAGNTTEQAVSLSINDVDDTGPAVSSVAITSATGVQNNTLNAGDVVSVTVGMNEATLVNTAGGTPRLALTIGSSTVYADYVSGTGTASLVFQYTILASQTDPNGISIAANALEANGGTLRDATGNDAVLTHALVADHASYLVDAAAPTLSSSAPTDNETDIAIGNNITLTFNETVLAGSGNIVISNGTDTRTISISDATQVSISGSIVTINPTLDLERGSTYNVQMAAGVLTDQAGNAFAGINDDTTLNFDTETVDSSIVVFDLVQGVSSDHSGRTFDANTSYTIFIRVDSNSHVLSTAGSGPGTWDTWSGANNLGVDDRIVLVGTGTPVKGTAGFGVTYLLGNPNTLIWASSGYAVELGLDGQLKRSNGISAVMDIWGGSWAANPNTEHLGAVGANVYLTQIPAGILTSQGLV